MEPFNQSMVTHFIIKGISEVSELQLPIFFLVLLIYLITVGGNLTVLLLVCLDRHLRTPMYFFLGLLSLVDVSSATVTLHKTLFTFVSGNKTIPYASCLIQMFCFGCFLSVELFIITAMSYDRYVAVCYPLQYVMIMNHRACVLLASGCFILSLFGNVPLVVLISQFSCYRSNIINHFFCDLLPIITISCSDTSLLETAFRIEGIVLFTPFLLTFISYVFIIAAILRIRSSIGRRKAFYTCSSHLTLVILFYATLTFQYLRPISEDTLDYNKLISLFNTAAVPILNPLIYTVKNKDVKSAFRRKLSYFQNTFKG
ncbi:olfactory receptor 8D1-like [Spea bombifrons]|uniref:olfactory receptor 8D1-like n=1 Tax=Spea bombifrons TaxID=233779 RepID=UPI00234BB660|nr:olfactory receptor 8D1-like [Spea bombifrons]